MTFHINCDWCGASLYKKDMAVIEVTIKRRRSNDHERILAQETRPTRHFCVNDEVNYDRLGLPSDEDDLGSCYERAIATITGERTQPPNLGLEWRLMPVDEPRTPRSTIRRAAADAQREERAAHADHVFESVEPALRRVIAERLPAARKFVLPRAGITTLDQVAAMSDEELLAIRGVGLGILRELRAAVAERENA